MANGTRTLAQVREEEAANGVKWIAVGTGIILFALLMLWMLSVVLRDNAAMLKVMRIGMGLGIVAGVAVIGGAAYRMSQVKSLKTVAFSCPYCDAPNQLLDEPTTDFECEACHQTVRFENGVMVPVRVISCGSCGTDNRVSVKSTRLICLKCNAVIQIQAGGPPAMQPVMNTVGGMPAPQGVRPTTAPPPQPARLLTEHNMDVLIHSYDHAREAHLLASLQNVLGVEPAQVKRLLGTITDRAPLIVGVDMPQAEADSLRVQLSQLGANVHVRPS